MEKVFVWAASLSRTQRNLIGSFVSAITFYSGAAGSIFLADAADLDSRYALGLISATFIVLVAFVVFTSKSLSDKISAVEKARELRSATINQAYTLCERVYTDKQERLENCEEKGLGLEQIISPSTESIKLIVLAAYHAFESTFGKSAYPEDRIDFEITFMTKSFKDNGITILTAANRKGTNPTSMKSREGNPNLYDSTVTAEIYRMASPRMVIVEDTNTDKYKELYPEQKKRILSSIIYPVLSKKNELLGTLVCHCDSKNFFQPSLEKYWEDLMQIFASRIALEMVNIICFREAITQKKEIDYQSLDMDLF